MANKERQFKIDFYCISSKGKRKHHLLGDALRALTENGCADAISLDGEDEKHQIRSVSTLSGKNAFSAVFGRCRFNEVLTQGDDTGAEHDVQLIPGHGLVEKNHLLFFPDTNLLVYQRNNNGSHHSKLQSYLNRLIDGGRFVLEPILQRDAYKKLLSGGEVKRFEVSFLAPSDSSLYEDLLTSKALSLLKECGANKGYIKMSVGRRNANLQSWIKDAVESMARSGLSTVARIKVEEYDHPIDLIADRLFKTGTVIVGDDGKVRPNAYFMALSNAHKDAAGALSAFFGD